MKKKKYIWINKTLTLAIAIFCCNYYGQYLVLHVPVQKCMYNVLDFDIDSKLENFWVLMITVPVVVCRHI